MKEPVKCPECSRLWPLGCEQADSIRDKGKCVCCVVDEEIHANKFSRSASEESKPLTGRGEVPMENQHKKITGYRDLSQQEIDFMNEAKELAEKCGQLIAKIEGIHGVDGRCVALGKTNLQQGFMWTIRGIARPTTF